MMNYRKCFAGSNCPKARQLPLGVLAPNSANQSRNMTRAGLVRNGRGLVIIPDGTTIKTGVYFASASLQYTAPTLIATINFDIPFEKIPNITVVVDDFGNDPAWVIHVRNVTVFSFDLVLKNANKDFGQYFTVNWSAFGEQKL